ncbi:hypothetical protein ASZ90_015560 [hydrocarbon metagenome]|uniref:Uncharacterized protein n=1 Tax=hydrocarbon metagenome TaxID=938273 RepID=A0A0W8F1W8_9ZZZZ
MYPPDDHAGYDLRISLTITSGTDCAGTMSACLFGSPQI